MHQVLSIFLKQYYAGSESGSRCCGEGAHEVLPALSGTPLVDEFEIFGWVFCKKVPKHDLGLGTGTGLLSVL